MKPAIETMNKILHTEMDNNLNTKVGDAIWVLLCGTGRAQQPCPTCGVLTPQSIAYKQFLSEYGIAKTRNGIAIDMDNPTLLFYSGLNVQAKEILKSHPCFLETGKSVSIGGKTRRCMMFSYDLVLTTGNRAVQ